MDNFRNPTIEEVCAIVSKLISIEVGPNSKLGSPPEWDSLTHLRIIYEIEQVYKCSVPAFEIGNLDSIQSIFAHVHGAKGESS